MAWKKSSKKKELDPDAKPFSEVVAERLIDALERGVAPWQKPWVPGEPHKMLPYNFATKNRYKGINLLVLMGSPYTDTRWLTYKQASELGAQVRAKEKGTMIQYWSFTKSITKKDAEGKPVMGADGKSMKEVVKVSTPSLFTSWVFNAEQIDGLQPEIVREMPEEGWAQLDRAEKLIEASEAKIIHDQHDKAFYRPMTDNVHMPDRSQFPTASAYYAVLFHELGHWSGSASRLKRDLSGSFGSESYAKEELRAEIASMIIGDELGIGHDPDRHAAYVGSWIKSLKEDPLEIFRAASDAEKICRFVMDFENNLEKAVDMPSDINEFDEPFVAGS